MLARVAILACVIACGDPTSEPLVDAGEAGVVDAPADAVRDVVTLPDAPHDAVDVIIDGAVDIDAGFTGVTFVEVEIGLDHVHDSPPIECMDFLGTGCDAGNYTGGVSVADVDGDGDEDLFFGSLEGTPKLYVNEDGRFVDATVTSGLDGEYRTNGAAFFDADGDGDLDLLALGYGSYRNFFFIRNAEGEFEERAIERGLDLTSTRKVHGQTVAFADFDRDGDLDIHVTEWIQTLVLGETRSNNRLLRNLGPDQPGYFEDVTVELGVDHEHEVSTRTPTGVFGYNSTFADLDDDGWSDLLLASDFGTTRLFWNDEGTFTDATDASGVRSPDLYGMGSAVGDANGDGHLDWFVTGITYVPEEGNRLFINRDDRTFAERSTESATRHTVWAWGAQFFDYDNDRDPDLIVGTGSSSTDGHPVLFDNDGAAVFENRARDLGLSYLGQARGVIAFDYDRDGDLDVLLVPNDDTPRLYRNDGASSRAWLSVRLRQDGANTRAIGARVELHVDGTIQVREVRGGGTFLGQPSTAIHFGLGDACPDDARLEIRWPDGSRDSRPLDECRAHLVIER